MVPDFMVVSYMETPCASPLRTITIQRLPAITRIQSPYDYTSGGDATVQNKIGLPNKSILMPDPISSLLTPDLLTFSCPSYPTRAQSRGADSMSQGMGFLECGRLFKVPGKQAAGNDHRRAYPFLHVKDFVHQPP